VNKFKSIYVKFPQDSVHEALLKSICFHRPYTTFYWSAIVTIALSLLYRFWVRYRYYSKTWVQFPIRLPYL